MLGQADLNAPPIDLRAIGGKELRTLGERLRAKGRVHIPDILTEASAAALRDEAQNNTVFQAVTTQTSGHIDLPAAWLASLTPNQRIDLARAVQETATTRFQYLYDNYPLWDLGMDGKLEGVWKSAFDFLTGEAFLGFARAVTGERRIRFSDAQVTRFRPGHFLTRHDDALAGKQRLFAYVLSLTPTWIADWGGLLMFHRTDGHVAEAFTPRFNTLNLLRVPCQHSVSQVSLFAGADRISITGWFRGGE